MQSYAKPQSPVSPMNTVTHAEREHILIPTCTKTDIHTVSV